MDPNDLDLPHGEGPEVRALDLLLLADAVNPSLQSLTQLDDLRVVRQHLQGQRSRSAGVKGTHSQCCVQTLGPLHFRYILPLQICSLQHQLYVSRKNSAMLWLLHTNC